MSVLFTMAQVAKYTKRYEDMCHYMRLYVQELAADRTNLNAEERIHLDFAYKRVSTSLRNVITMLNGRLKDHPKDTYESTFYKHKQEAQKKLTLVCNEILEILEKILIPGAANENNMNTLICYRTMAGDYHRYLAEGTDVSVQKSVEYYTLAYQDSQKLLTASIRYSVYLNNITGSPEKAFHTAKTAFDSAVTELYNLAEDEYKANIPIMKVIRHNLYKKC
jgi:14-3-3 protein epsilon